MVVVVVVAQRGNDSGSMAYNVKNTKSDVFNFRKA